MDLRQLRYFFAVCDWGSLATAARRLGTTSSNLSTQICQLEHEFGGRLCERSSAGLEVTAAGEHLYRVGKRLAHEFEFATRYAASGDREAPRSLTFGTPLMPRGSVLAQSLWTAQRALMRDHAHLNVRIADFAMPVTSEYDLCAVLDAQTGGEAAINTTKVEDRWCLVSRRTGAETQVRETSLDDLRRRPGVHIVLPRLPPDLAAAAAQLASSVNIEAFDSKLPAELVNQDALFGNGNYVLMPLSCVPGCWFQRRFHVSLLVTPEMNPGWSLQRAGDVPPQILHRFATAFSESFDARVASALDPEPTKGVNGASDDAYPVEIGEARSFDVAFEFGNISRAAAELRISQPALSTGLRRLEERLGKQLFRRTSHGVVPTEHGMALRENIHPVLQDFGELRRALIGLRANGPAPIRVGMVPALDEDSLLAEAMAFTIAEWSDRFKQSEITVVEGFNTRLRRWTVQEELDLAIVDTNVRQSGLVLTPLLEDAMVVVTSPQYRGIECVPINGADVNRLKLALPSSRHGLRGVLDRAFRDAGLILIPKIEIDSMATAVKLVKSGDWATILPVSAVRAHAATGALQVNEIVNPTVTRELSMIRRSDRRLDDRCARFVEMFTTHLRARYIADGFVLESRALTMGHAIHRRLWSDVNRHGSEEQSPLRRQKAKNRIRT